MATIDTVWEVWTYDVWGNARDGWDVNDRRCQDRAYPIKCKVKTFNVGTDREFNSATPTSRQIREALGLTGWRGGITTDGDDLTIYVESSRNGYPIGELTCVSHDSLSPIRKGPKAHEKTTVSGY
jgi:hypothetical protein